METKPLSPRLECAAAMMEVVPVVMQHIRSEMRRQRLPSLSVPQLRALVYLYRNEGASLSGVADHVGLELPSMSKAIDALAGRSLVIRRVSASDRRCASLRLSARGRAELKRARGTAEAYLAEKLGTLSPAEQAAIVYALRRLGQIFAPEGPASATKAR